MIVAISLRQEKNKHGSAIDVLEHDYTSYFEQFGILLIPIPNQSNKVAEYFEKFNFDAVILSGGNDVDPRLYGGSIKSGRELSIMSERDQTEKLLVELALVKNIPIVGICRGMQFLNVYFGGMLMIIKEMFGESVHLPGQEHEVRVVDSVYEKIIGKDKVYVNSYHNQGVLVADLASVLHPFALSSEGIVEGYYHSTLPIVGIQWHPERKSSDASVSKLIIEHLFHI